MKKSCCMLSGYRWRRLFRCIIIISMCLLPVTVWGATFSVSTVDAFRSALTEAAGNGEDDTIIVTAGTYTVDQQLSFVSGENHSLTINAASGAHPVIDAQQSSRCLYVDMSGAGASFRMSDLVLINGSTGESGGALLVQTTDGSVCLRRCEIRNSRVTGDSGVGGGASLTSDTGRVSVEDCSFLNNFSSANVGGLFTGTNEGTIMLSGSEFTGNQVDNAGGNTYFGDAGGAMMYSEVHGTAVARRNVFRNNSTDGGDNPDGGGLMIYLLGEDVSATVEANTFSNNSAGLGGGGCFVRVNGSGTVTFDDNELSANTTSIGDGGGAFIYMDSGNTAVGGNRFSDNVSAGDGGGLWMQTLYGACTLSNNVFTGNRSGNNGGGCSVYVETASMVLTGNVFDTNSATAVGGGVSFGTVSGRLSLERATFYNNTADNGGGVYLYMDQGDAQLTLRNLILWQDQPNEMDFSWGSAPGALMVTYSDVSDGASVSWTGTGCFDSDPMFVDPENGDFHLSWAGFPEDDTSKSPCIDTGDPAMNDPDGTRSDIGALYFNQNPSECDTLGVTLFMPSHDFGPGDTCSCTVMVCNPEDTAYADIPLFVILDVYGTLFFWPSFGEFDYQIIDVDSGETGVTILPAFDWPDQAGNAAGIFWYAGMTDPGMTELFGELDTWEFGWHEP